MHTIQSLAHRAAPPSATCRRWKPYAATPSAVIPTCYKSPYLTPACSVSSSPSSTGSDIERIHSVPTLPPQQVQSSQTASRENPKTKYALGLVDQAVKVLGDIWRPHDIPEVFTATRSSASSSLCSDLTVSLSATSTSYRNIQTPPLTPTSLPHTSPLPHFDYLATTLHIDEPVEHRKNLVPLRSFVQEVLKRSKTTGSVLQTALCYLEAIRPQVAECSIDEKNGCGVRGEPELGDRIIPGAPEDFETEVLLGSDLASLSTLIVESNTVSTLPSTRDTISIVKSDPKQTPELLPLPPLPSPLLCPRRTFLASLILASKFMQDKSYSNRAWAKLSGLPPREISRCERALGDALGWRLWVGKTPVTEPSAASAAVATGLVRCRSESNLVPSPAPFIPSPTLPGPSPPVGRSLRRCSTLPNDAFRPANAVGTGIEEQGQWRPVSSASVPTPASLETSPLAYVPQVLRPLSSAESTPPTPGLVYSPSSSSSTSDTSGDKTIQMSCFEDTGSFGPEISCATMEWTPQVGSQQSIMKDSFEKLATLNLQTPGVFVISPPSMGMDGIHALWAHDTSKFMDNAGML